MADEVFLFFLFQSLAAFKLPVQSSPVYHVQQEHQGSLCQLRLKVSSTCFPCYNMSSLTIQLITNPPFISLSIMAVNNELPTSHGKSLLQFISNILANESEDSETAYRTIVALGNMVSSPNIAGSLPVGDVQLAKELASGLASKLGDARLVKVAQEI